MTRSIENGQPTPKQVVKDALSSIPPFELQHAVPAQTTEEDALEGAYTPQELIEMTSDLSRGIIAMLKIKPGEVIRDSYEPNPGQFVRHQSLDSGKNHYWRVASPSRTLEVRTGPFFDDAVNTAYDPEIKVTDLREVDKIPPSGRQAFEEGIKILSEVFLA